MNPAVERIAAHRAELGGGLAIARALPTSRRRLVGAWCFLDHIGPVDVSAGPGLHVGAHPHIGLQTFTWMIEGRILHRDSLGSEQLILPGQVNLMTAGSGIVHTEDSLPGESRIHAAQLWIALPLAVAACAPRFDHHPVLPGWDEQGSRFTLLAGEYGSQRAPLRLESPLFGLDVNAHRRARHRVALRREFEYGILVMQGQLALGGELFAVDEFACLAPGSGELELTVEAGTRLLLLGGEPLDQRVLLWWNYVSSAPEEIARAQHDWETGAARFGPVPGDGDRRLVAPAMPRLAG